jgi:hypothetical protein
MRRAKHYIRGQDARAMNSHAATVGLAGRPAGFLQFARQRNQNPKRLCLWEGAPAFMRGGALQRSGMSLAYHVPL